MTDQFQTPPEISDLMAGMINSYEIKILEPTPGNGNIVTSIMKVAKRRNQQVSIDAPADFFKLKPNARFDCIIMNPPFSEKSCYGHPQGIKDPIGYHILKQCLQMSHHVIALMPWSTIINSDARLAHLMEYGIINITALPRSVFPRSRVQCCILNMIKGHTVSPSLLDLKKASRIYTVI